MPPLFSFPRFSDEVTAFLDEAGVKWVDVHYDWEAMGLQMPPSLHRHRLISLSPDDEGTPALALHLISSPASLTESLAPDWTRRMTEQCGSGDDDDNGGTSQVGLATNTQLRPRKIVHLHQDVWRSKNLIVRARLLARVGQITSRIYGRKTVCRRIDRPTALSFLEANHLWGAVRAKFNYGLFAGGGEKGEEERLVAVASFGPRRRVVRAGKQHSSHELIRFCTLVNGQVVGGLSKLVTHFVREHKADDVVTVIDRDWGAAGSGWHRLGFDTVHVMPSLVMAVGGDDGIRHHLVGAGLKLPEEGKEREGGLRPGARAGLPAEVHEELGKIDRDDWKGALRCLAEHNFFPVHDVGVERLVLFPGRASSGTKQEGGVGASELWEASEPKYANIYYSNNSGIDALLRRAELACGYD